MDRCLWVLLGGGTGSVARYLLGRAVVQRFPNAHFQYGTFLINVTGSFLIGLLMTLLVERLRAPEYLRLFLVVGFLGGYTTFSSFEYEGYLTMRSGHQLTGFMYLVGSVVAGYGAVLLGVLAAGKR